MIQNSHCRVLLLHMIPAGGFSSSKTAADKWVEKKKVDREVGCWVRVRVREYLKRWVSDRLCPHGMLSETV
jgi:hypothetical protein